mgnify:CR=1 FL=1
MRYWLLILIFLVSGATAQENLIRNAEFDDGRRYWRILNENDSEITFDFPTDSVLSGAASARIEITTGGSTPSDVVMYQSLSLEEGKTYRISFMAIADTPRTFRVKFQEGGVLNRTFWQSPELNLGQTSTHYGPFTFKCNVNASNRLRFELGGLDNVTVRFDSVWVTAEDRPGYVRTVDKFEKRQHTFESTTLPYRLCRPDFYDPNERYPLVLALHGAGERGTDNQIHIDVHRLATSWADSTNQAEHPCFVVAPQCPKDNRWADADWSPGFHRISQVPVGNEVLTVMDLVDSLVQEFPVDTNRLYITGLSMGGQGTWDILARYPAKFTAAIPMSGGGDSTRALQMKHIPMWIFHGENDNTVPVSASRQMVEAMENQGLTAVYTHCHEGDCTGMTDTQVADAVADGARLLYTEWKNAGHVMWAESYDYPHLFPWVFAQNKQNNPPAVSVHQSTSQTVLGFGLQQNFPNPFNANTTLEYSLSQPSEVRIELFNIRGQKVKDIWYGKAEAGLHRVTVNAEGLPSGNYIYQLSADELVDAKIMTLQK